MVRSFLFFLSFGLGVFALASCTSLKKTAFKVYLKKFQENKAQGMALSAPSSSYKPQQHTFLDALWWNSKTQSSISYFSTCSKNKKTLESFQYLAFPEDGNYKILKKVKNNGSLYSELEIYSEQKKVFSGIYTLKKEECYFNLNLVAPSELIYKGELVVFKKFIKGFK